MARAARSTNTSLERWMAGDGEAFLETRRAPRAARRAVRFRSQRVGSNDWPDTFGFVARPGGGKVT